MRSLRVVPPGELDVADDGSYEVGPSALAGQTGRRAAEGIVVEAEDGERFQLSLDEALREAVGPAVAVLTTPQAAADPEAANATRSRPRTPSPHPLSPREIQTRIRAGESAQELAEDSGTEMDKIMRFAYAVLEERARVADEARRARARRDGDGNLVPFGETVDGRFAVHDIEPQSVEWDSFRRPDGSWVVTAAWTADGTERHAHWAFSLTARTVLPLDQVSSDLLSDRPLRPAVRAVPLPETGPAGELYDQEAPDSAGYAATTPPIGWLRNSSATSTSAGAASTSTASNPAASNPAASTSTAWTPASSTSTAWTPAARGTRDEPANHPRLPLRLAEPWSEDAAPAGDRSGRRHARAEDDPIEDSANTEADTDGEGVDGIDVGGDTKLGELFHDDIVDDNPPADDAPAASSSSGRTRASRSQSKVPRWDDILLSTRRKND